MVIAAVSSCAQIADACRAEIIEALDAAIRREAKDVDPILFHENVRRMYRCCGAACPSAHHRRSWYDVAERTTKVYDMLMASDPTASADQFVERLSSYAERSVTP